MYPALPHRLNSAITAVPRSHQWTALSVIEWRSADMAKATDQLIDLFASQLSAAGVPIRREDNTSRLKELEAKLPRRLLLTFASLLSRYSFASFNAGGITFFGWGAVHTEFAGIARPAKGSLSELLLPSGYIQVGRPDTGDSDAVCFDLNVPKQNREYRIVQANHEEILCNSRVKIRTELWPSFRKLAEQQILVKQK